MRRWSVAFIGLILPLGTNLVLGTVPISAATAPKGENITASPTQIQPALDAGATTTGDITIINDGDQAYDFKSYATPYRISGEDYDQSFTTGPGLPDVTTWIHLPATTFHLGLRQTTTVPYTITVPKGIAAGGYYATLFFQTLPKPVATGSGIASQQRVGIVAYIRVNGAITEHGTLESFTAALLQKGAPVTATLRLANQGNVHYSADITEHITDLFGQPKGEVHVIREVLPQTTRRIILSWDKAPSFGLFRLNGVVDLLGRHEVLPARYVLVLSAGAFIAVSAALLLIVILAVWWWIGRRRPART
jgi:hypothetical protein